MNDNIKIEPIEMDNGIGFRGSVSLSKEEIEKRVDFLEEHSKEFNKLVIKAENELYIKELLKRNNQLQSNWNNLRELIRWRPIEEYDENKYDWVLVKYYDGDYECVPTVAERRKGTNKWYDTNYNEIIFEVKYFFDMQLLDKMNELEREKEDERKNI